MAEKLNLSIVILNYNTHDLLRACLKSIQSTNKGQQKIETIVVDNASTDSSLKMIEEEFPWVRLIASKTNLGFAAGNNQAIPIAKGRYLLFLNPDTVLPKNIFPQVIDYMEQNKDIGALTVRLRLQDGTMDPDCHRGFPTPWASFTYFIGLEKLFPKSKVFGQYHQSYLPLDKIHEIHSACGAFLLVRREALEDIGNWDESYFFYGEDIDFCFRLRAKNWKIVYYPQIEVLHYKGASSGLRSETKILTKASRQTRIRAAKASIEAMKIFYNKFYRQKYPWFVTSIIITGIQIKGWFRVLFNYLKG